MADTAPVGTMPSPYGVSIPVYALNDPSDPEGYSFDLDGSMTMAGIHDPASRSRCKVAVKARMGGAGVPFSVFMEFGGQPVPRSALTPVTPDSSFYNDMPMQLGIRDICDNWITRVADHHRWCDRAEHLLEMVTGHVAQWDGHMPHELIALALSRMLTSVLENMGESEIDCLEAAAFYALSGHDQWRQAACEWLYPMRRTWWADWTKPRVGYRRFARMTLKLHDDVPAWLAGGAP